MLMQLPHLEAKRVFEIEAAAIASLAERVDETFDDAIRILLNGNHRVIVSGIGKSGIVARKVASTLASTGTPSIFLHPAEAFHGDLGVIGKGDVILAFSNSGETEELLRLLPFLRDNGNALIAVTGNPTSRLAMVAAVHLDAGVAEEACPFQLAPTASTTASMAMGDAIAVALMKSRAFEPENFARLHPGGSLGRRLLMKVADEMVCDHLPIVEPTAKALEVIKRITDGKLGLAIVHHDTGVGIVTDGDVRRAIEGNGEKFFTMTAIAMMTPHPVVVDPAMATHEAIELMHRSKITSLLVQSKGKIVGVFKK